MSPALFAGAAAALPTPGGLGLQEAASPVMRDIRFFHDALLMPIMTAVCVLVLGLLIYVVVRYNRRANPTPAKFTHNVTIEVIWTAVPVAILVVIGLFSFPLLYKAEAAPPADLTVKTIGQSAWYWSYEYPDHGGFTFDSFLTPEEELPADQKHLRLLAVDNPMVVPVGKTVRVLVTANPGGWLHSWAMPAFGVKQDAVPGRINETWFRAEREGDFYGQCSELCGAGHAYMPIHVKVVSEAEFARWAATMAEEYAQADASNVRVAHAKATLSEETTR